MKCSVAMQCVLVPALAVCLCTLAAAEEAEHYVTAACAWLAQSQDVESGSWGPDPVRDTAAVLQIVHLFPGSGIDVSAARGYLSAQQPVSSDYLARKIMALADDAHAVHQDVDELVLRQNSDGGFGFSDGYPSSLIDSILALDGLALAGVDGDAIALALGYLTALQHSSGSLSYERSSPASLEVTCRALLVMHRLQPRYNLSSFIVQAAGFIATQHNSDGGFGEDGSSVIETSLAILALQAAGNNAQAVLEARTYLVSVQNPVNGSWNGRVRDTALALAALHASTGIDLPNLQVHPSGISLQPAYPAAGKEVTVTCEVRNTGSIAAENIEIELYLGDPAAGGQLLDSGIITHLAAGNSTSVQWSFVLTDEPGNADLYVTVDPRDLIPEISNADNVAIKKFTSGTLPDLVIERIDLSTPSPQANEPFTLSATAVNLGETDATEVFVGLYAGDPATSEPLLEVGLGNLCGGCSSRADFELTLPAGTYAYNLYVSGSGDLEEQNLDNNIRACTVTVLPPAGPGLDLAVTAADISFLPAYPRENEQVRITARIRNRGDVAARDAEVEVYAVDSAAVSTLLHTFSNVHVSAGSTADVTLNGVLLSPGNYTIFISIIPASDQHDIEPANNTASAPLSVIDSDAVVDLAVDDLSFSPVMPHAGEPVLVRFRITNHGNTGLAGVTFGIYDNDPRSGGQLVIDAVQTLGYLDAGQSRYASGVFDTTGRGGEQTLYVMIDADNAIAETDEDNNITYGSVTVVHDPGPDIVLNAGGLEFSPAHPSVEDELRIDCTVNNQGSSNISGPFQVALYAGPPQGDMQPIAVAAIDSLNAHASVKLSFTTQAALFAASQTIFVHADYQNTIAETNEYNNTASMDIAVSAPDLEIRDGDLSIESDPLLPGQPFALNAVIHNIGTHGARDVEAVVYSGPPESSPELGRVSLPLVAAGSSETTVFSISLPAGAHTLHVVVDPDGYVAESGTANNSASITVTVGLPDEDPVLDLAASRVRVNSNSLPDSAAITVRVSNSGTVDVDPGIDVAFYEADPAENAILLGVEQTASGLAAGAQADVTFTWDHPAEGEYQLFVVADDDGTGQGRLTEIDETNNTAVATVTITYLTNWKDRAVSQGAQWLVDHQHHLGGWEAFTPARANAAALQALYVSGMYLDPEFSDMYAALLQRVLETQATNGSWENSVHATADSVLAMLSVGEDISSPAIRNAVVWLKIGQQDDGGWNNSPPQTGHAVWALMEAGESRDDPAVQKARQWLLENWNINKYWGTTAGEYSNLWTLHYPVIGLQWACDESDSDAQDVITKAVNWYKNLYIEVNLTNAYLAMLFYTGRNAGDIEKNMNNLVKLQSSNGGWVQAKKSSTPLEDPQNTAESVISLYRHSETGGGAAIRKAFQWLKTMRVEPDGDFQYPYDQSSPTSLALLALNSVNDHGEYNESIADALVRVVKTQKSNGNWNPDLSMSAHHLLRAATALLRALVETELTVADKSTAVSKAVAYLILFQNKDGGWFNRGKYGISGPSYVSSTIGSLLGLLSDNVVLTEDQRTRAGKAITWLLGQKTGSANWETISYTADALKVLDQFGVDQSQIDGGVSWLKQCQNPDGGWGEHESTVQDTARVLLALIQTGNQCPETARAVQWLLAVQNADGGWPILPGLRTCTNPTSYAVRALALADYTPGPELAISFDKSSYLPGEKVTVSVEHENDMYNVQQVSGTITEYGGGAHSISFAKVGRVFIGTHVLSSGHIAGTDVVSVEAQTLEGVAGYGVGTFVVENATELKCDLSVAGTDIMFSPEVPDEGRMVLIAAQVHNIGLAASPQTTVRFLNGTQQIGSDQALASLAPGASDSVFMQWDTLGQKGRNYIHVVVDPLNEVNDVNRVNNHAIRAIDVSQRSLPDLEVRDADISFADASPVEGALVGVSAAVRNLGAAIDGVVVHFYDGEISEDTLITSRIIHEVIPHGGSRTVSAVFDTAGRAGRCRIIVQADPHAMIREQNEANNTGSAELDVQSGGLGLELSLERDSYVHAEDVLAGAAITSSFDHERVVTLDLSVYDPSGILFAQVARDTVIVLPFGGTVIIDDLVWNTAHAPAGQWRVVATLFEDAQRRAEDRAAFLVLADRTISADISTERQLYYDHAQVRISTVLQSFSPNYAFTGLSALVDLLSPEGDVLYMDEHAIEVLPLLVGRSWDQYWNTALHPPGLYTLNLSVEQDGTPVASGSAHFTIARSTGGGRGLTGYVSVAPGQVHPGQDVLLTWGISSVGNVAPDQAQVFISAVYSATQDVALVHEDSCYFEENTCSNTLVLDTSALACGDYVLLLAARADGATQNLAFAPVAVVNRCPVAVTGADVFAHVGDTVQLDGSGSYDTDGHSLTYSWSPGAMPQESLSELVGADQYNPTLTIDRHGTYELRLIVSDGMCQSQPDSVLVTTQNRPPVAVAGESLLVEVGETVQLDGSASHDPDGDVIEHYEWTMVVRPEGSTAAISDRFAPNPVFTADMPGEYRLQLIVRDFEYSSDPVELVVTTINRRPIADAGPDREVNVGDGVHLDGSGSHDPDGDTLSYRWSILSAPEGSTAVLNDSTAPAPVFTADKSGTYIVQLIVNDGELDSIPHTCVITTRNLPSECVDDLGVAQQYSIFALNRVDSSHAVVAGRIAAGGNAELHTVVMATQVPRGAPQEPVLVSGGDIVYSSGVVHRGSIVAAGSVDGVADKVRRTMARGSTVIGNADLPFDFEQESSRLQQLAARLAELSTTGTPESFATILTLRGDGSSPIQIFSISAQQLRRARSLHLWDIPRTATVIINISGEQAAVSHIGMAVPGWMRGQVLFNFFEARSLACTAVALKGSVLAPLTELTNSSGIIFGTVIVDSWHGSMNVGHEPFIGQLPECEP